MGRDFVRKTPRVSADALNKAIEAVRNGAPVRTAARDFGVPRGTLQRRVKMPELKKPAKQIFSDEQEADLKEYLLRSAAMRYGLSLKATCIQAYQYAQSIGIKVPKSWQVNKIAGIEWLRAFRKRHPDFTLPFDIENLATKLSPADRPKAGVSGQKTIRRGRQKKFKTSKP